MNKRQKDHIACIYYKKMQVSLQYRVHSTMITHDTHRQKVQCLRGASRNADVRSRRWDSRRIGSTTRQCPSTNWRTRRRALQGVEILGVGLGWDAVVNSINSSQMFFKRRIFCFRKKVILVHPPPLLTLYKLLTPATDGRIIFFEQVQRPSKYVELMRTAWVLTRAVECSLMDSDQYFGMLKR